MTVYDTNLQLLQKHCQSYMPLVLFSSVCSSLISDTDECSGLLSAIHAPPNTVDNTRRLHNNSKFFQKIAIPLPTGNVLIFFSVLTSPVSLEILVWLGTLFQKMCQGFETSLHQNLIDPYPRVAMNSPWNYKIICSGNIHVICTSHIINEAVFITMIIL